MLKITSAISLLIMLFFLTYKVVSQNKQETKPKKQPIQQPQSEYRLTVSLSLDEWNALVFAASPQNKVKGVTVTLEPDILKEMVAQLNRQLQQPLSPQTPDSTQKK